MTNSSVQCLLFLRHLILADLQHQIKNYIYIYKKEKLIAEKYATRNVSDAACFFCCVSPLAQVAFDKPACGREIS